MGKYDTFREAALTFQETGTYCKFPKGSKSYKTFWLEQEKRSLEGYHCGWDYIPGYYYWYLNFSPIQKVIPKKDSRGIIVYNPDGTVQGDRIESPADWWDYDYKYFHYLDEAEKSGKHGIVLKARGKGYSFKGGSMLTRNYFLIRGSKSYALAAEKEYLIKDGLLTKAFEMMSFVDQNTAFSKRRQFVNLPMHKRASYESSTGGVKSEAGYKSEIIGITLKNDANRARGKRGKLMLFEEAGKFPALLQAWNISRDSMEQGNVVQGLMVAYGTGGCLTAGNKVWNNKGELVNIENLKQEDGIIGFLENKGYSKEDITWFQPPTEKDCYRIETNTGRWLECSYDHPIYKAILSNNYITSNEFTEAKELNVGDYIGVIENVDIWQDKKLENARVIGWLIGDGTYGSSTRIANCEPEILSYLESNFDCTTNIQYQTKLNKTYKELTIKNFVPSLRGAGIYGQTKLRKTLPNNIHGYSKDSVCELLGGLFDTDGYVSFRKNKSRDNSCISEISISQASKNLVLEIQLLLQKLGIHSGIRIRQPRKNNPIDRNPWYELCIRDTRSLITFYENIKLYPKDKQDRLELIYQYQRNKLAQRKYSGLRYERVTKIEYAGIKQVYNLTASNTHTYIGNGIITHNTEGADFEAMKEMFENPKGYNILPVNNTWEENRENSQCGFFVPDYMNLEGFMNPDGESDVERAIKYIEADRKIVLENTRDTLAYKRRCAEHPMTPTEAMMRLEGNIFPVQDLAGVLARVELERDYEKTLSKGFFEIDETGQVNFKQDNTARILYNFPVKQEDNKNAPCVLYEMPFRNGDEKVQSGMYIAGIDSFDLETGVSLGSCIIINKTNNRVVAEYTARPQNPNDFYEQCRRLLMYYNARALYENGNKGIFTYFEGHGGLYLLCEEPTLIQEIIKKPGPSRRFGVRMTDEVKRYAETLTYQWLIKDYDTEKNIKVYHKIRSIGLLKELMAYNRDVNVDRVSSLFCLMLQLDEEKRYIPMTDDRPSFVPMHLRGLFGRKTPVEFAKDFNKNNNLNQQRNFNRF